MGVWNYRSDQLKKLLDDTTLRLEIERGKLEPMVTPSMDMTFEKSQNKQKTDESKFTIVLDKERGIYKIWNHQKSRHLMKFIFLIDIYFASLLNE